jgi:tripartite-type tricarboxylate transporter receptor subunit TctC
MRRVALATLFASVLAAAAAADYPDRPIRFVVPQAAGSNSDLYARVLAAEMSRTLGQQLIVENRPGGAFVIGLDQIAKAPPDGKVRALGVSGEKRSPAFPDVPAIAEVVPGYVAVTWLGVVAPAQTPRPVVERLNRAVNAALASPLMTDRFKLIGEEAAPGTPEDYAAVIKTDFAKWKAVIERSSIRLQE